MTRRFVVPSMVASVPRPILTSVVAPPLPPDGPIAIVPNTGSDTGGTHVVIQVASSAGLTGAEIDLTPITGFAVDDGTHVSGDSPMLAIGARNVSVSNANGRSTPNGVVFTYT